MSSKLGLLFLGNPGNWLTHIQRMRPTVSALMDWDSPETAEELKRYSQFVLYRQYVEGGIDVSPEEFIARIPSKMFGHGLFFQGACETYCKTKDDALRVSAWFQQFGTLMKQRGEQAVAFDFSTGNPPLEVVSYLDPGDCAYIGLHEYYSTTHLYYMMQMHESFYNSLKSANRRPILITETGWDEGKGYEDGDGWLGHVHATNAQYMEVFRNYDAILMRSDYVVGSVAFQLGSGGQWKSFDLNPLVNQLADYVQSAGGGKVWTMPTENPVYSISVSPTSIQVGQSATLSIVGEHIKAGWLVWSTGNEPLAPVTQTRIVKPTATITYTLRVQLPDNSYVNVSTTLTVTTAPEPPPTNQLPSWVTTTTITGAGWYLRDAWYVENASTCNIYVLTEKNGAPATGIKVRFTNGGITDQITTLKDGKARTDFPQTADSNFDPNSPDPARQHGPYSAQIAEANSVIVSGMGLPLKQHVEYWLVYEYRESGTPPTPPPDGLDEAIAKSKDVTAYLESLKAR